AVNVGRAANVRVGTGLAMYAAGRLALTVGPAQAGAFALTLAAGSVVVYSFWLVLVTLTFWFVRIDNIEQIVWQAYEAGRYPVEIYPSWLRTALTYVVPVLFIITVPAQALAGRLNGSFIVVAAVVAAASV